MLFYQKIPSQMKRQKGFSLIELSITILIVGIMISGVVKGSRMVKSARLSSARNLTKTSPVATIKGLSLWLDAARGNSLSSLVNSSDTADIENEDEIKAWIDANPTTPTNISFDAPTSSDYPTYLQYGLNGLPTISFDGVSDRLLASIQLGELLNGEEGTIFIVSTSRNFAGGTRTMGIYGSPSRVDLTIDSTVSFSWRDSVTYTATAVPSPSLEGKSNIVSLRRRKTGRMDIKVDGVALGTAITNADSILDLSETVTFSLGWNAIGTTLSPEVDISEVIIYNRGLSDDERKEVESYLSQKWLINLLQ